jgi:serine/threonine protein kinase
LTGGAGCRHIAGVMPQGVPEYLGKYQLLQPLARGGMAELHLARQEGIAGFEKMVVIKRVLPHLAQYRDFATMFLDEARIAAKLSHPNIVQYFDFGEADGSYYIAMEYLAGEDLAAIVRAGRKRDRRLPEVLAAYIMAAACDGLHYAHTLVDESGRALNIVHRDISPSNIFVTYQGAVKVLDFGIAKAEGKLSRTRTGLLKGKYLYMSPEQVRGDPLDGRSDVFALGAVLYEILTDAPAFLRDSELDTLRAIMLEEVEPPRSKAPEVSEAMQAIVLKALAPDLERRYRSAQHMRKALEEYLFTHARGTVSAQLQSYVRELMGEDRVSQRLRTATFAATRQRAPAPPSSPERSAPPLFEADSEVRAARGEALLEAGAELPAEGQRAVPTAGAGGVAGEVRPPTQLSRAVSAREGEGPVSTRKLRPSGSDPSERITLPEAENAGEGAPVGAHAMDAEPPAPLLSGPATGPRAAPRAPAPGEAPPAAAPNRGRFGLLTAAGLGACFAVAAIALGRQGCGAAQRSGDLAALAPVGEPADASLEPWPAPAPDAASAAASIAAPGASSAPGPGEALPDAGSGAPGKDAGQLPQTPARPLLPPRGPKVAALPPARAPASAPAAALFPERPRGLLQVTCSPQCLIFIDGESSRRMAPRQFRVDPGRHVVRAVNLATQEVKEKAVEISLAEPVSVFFDFHASAPDGTP